jgi:hypothetical protein
MRLLFVLVVVLAKIEDEDEDEEWSYFLVAAPGGLAA